MFYNHVSPQSNLVPVTSADYMVAFSKIPVNLRGVSPAGSACSVDTGAGILPNCCGLLQPGKEPSIDQFSNAAANFQSYQT